MNEWLRIFSDRKRRVAFIFIPILCFALFFYQKCDGDFGALAADAHEYQEMLERYRDNTPEEIKESFHNFWDMSKNEERLLTQAEHLWDYEEYLVYVQKQAATMQSSSLFNSNRDSFVYRNILKTAADFEKHTAEGLYFGNYRAVQDWLEFELADWMFLVSIVLLVMSFLEERQKGLAAIIRSCPAGRAKLQFSRLGVLLGYSAGITILLYYVPLLVSLCMDGGWSDLVRPVQSMAEFRTCVTEMTILEFLGQYFLVKTACGFLIGLLIWLLLSMLGQVLLSWMLTAAGLSLEYLLYRLISPLSIFSPLRYVNVFSYVFSSDLYTQYVNINFFEYPVQNRALLLGLLVVLTVILSAVTVTVLAKRYPFGNKDHLEKWLHRWNKAADFIRRPLGLYGFEGYKLLFLTAGGLFLLLGILLTQNIRCNSGAYNRMEDITYRQYVAQIQGPVDQSTYDYLAEARQELAHSDLDTSEFETALNRLEQHISDLPEGAWLVDETFFLNIYGSKAWITQRRNALTALIFLLACLSPLFACEVGGDVRKILHSTPGGRQRLFWAKYRVALSVTVIVWLRVFGQEWQAAKEILGNGILSAPCSSISSLPDWTITVNSFLLWLYLSKFLGLLIPMHLCLYFGARSCGFEKTFLLNAVILLLPAAAYSFHVEVLQYFTPIGLLADGNVLLSNVSNAFLMSVWMALSVIALVVAKRHWCRV